MPGSNKTVVVSLPPNRQQSLDETNKIVAQVLNHVGCPTCFSGRDIHFLNEMDSLVASGAGNLESVDVRRVR